MSASWGAFVFLRGWRDRATRPGQERTREMTSTARLDKSSEHFRADLPVASGDSMTEGHRTNVIKHFHDFKIRV